jgi:hypothetical protein
MSELQQMSDLVTRDPLPHTRPDVASLIGRGRRLQHRRRAAYGAIGVATVATVTGVLVAGQGPGPGRESGFADTSGHPTPTPHHVRHSRSVDGFACPVAGGIFVCERPPRERFAPLGEVVPIGHRTDGSPEVLYAVEQPGVNMRTGRHEKVIAVHAGLQRVDGLYGQSISLQPGTGPDLPIPMEGGTQDGRYAIAGAVPVGAYDTITWTDSVGRTHPVTGVSTTMVPGWTVFWLYGTDGEGPPYDFDKVVVHAGSTSCSLRRCAVQGGF